MNMLHVGKSQFQSSPLLDIGSQTTGAAKPLYAWKDDSRVDYTGLDGPVV